MNTPFTYSTYAPFSLLAEADRLFREFRDADRIWRGAPTQAGALLNVWQDDARIVVTTEVPGVEAKDIDVQIVGDTLTIAAKRSLPEPGEHGRWLRRERQAFAVRRAVQLPVRVDPDSTRAQLRDGLLTVVLTRAAEDRPRAIAIQAA